MNSNALLDTLKRFFFAIIYAVIINALVIWFMFLCSIIQHLHWWITKSKNDSVQKISNYLYVFLIQSLDYVMMYDDALPYPFKPLNQDIEDKFTGEFNKVVSEPVTDIPPAPAVQQPNYKKTVQVVQTNDVKQEAEADKKPESEAEKSKPKAQTKASTKAASKNTKPAASTDSKNSKGSKKNESETND